MSLRRLNASTGERGLISVELVTDSALDWSGELTAWLEWPGVDGPSFALARTRAALLAWCSATGAYEIDSRAGRIRVASPRLDDSWEHRLGTMAIPLLLSERGDLALHASAVVTSPGAVLFSGPSGRGKSALALLASRHGHPVLTEDGAVVDCAPEAAVVWPGARGVRVGDELAAAAGLGPSRRANDAPRPLRTLDADVQASEPAPVSAICLLMRRGARLEVGRLSPSEAVPALVPSLIHAGGPLALRHAFERLVRLVERVPVYRVTMPDRASGACDATRALLAEVAP